MAGLQLENVSPGSPAVKLPNRRSVCQSGRVSPSALLSLHAPSHPIAVSSGHPIVQNQVITISGFTQARVTRACGTEVDMSLGDNLSTTTGEDDIPVAEETVSAVWSTGCGPDAGGGHCSYRASGVLRSTPCF